jgi:subtilisin family serine protease
MSRPKEPSAVDVAAPGVRILQQTICENGRNRCEQFAAWSGTSMAAPITSLLSASALA